jgi:hypothetical protein
MSEELSLRVSRLEVANQDLKEQVQYLSNRLAEILDNPDFMTAISNHGITSTINYIREVGMDVLDPSVMARVSAEAVDHHSIKLIFNSDDIFQPGGFKMEVVNDAGEFVPVTSMRRRNLDCIYSALGGIKKKKWKGTTMWATLYLQEAAAPTEVPAEEVLAEA